MVVGMILQYVSHNYYSNLGDVVRAKSCVFLGAILHFLFTLREERSSFQGLNGTLFQLASLFFLSASACIVVADAHFMQQLRISHACQGTTHSFCVNG